MPIYDRVIALPTPPKDRSLLVIGGIVIAVHFLLMLWAVLAEGAPKKIAQPAAQRLVVQTVTLNPKRPLSSAVKPAPPILAMQVPDPEPVVVEKNTIVAEQPKPEAAKKEEPVEVELLSENVESPAAKEAPKDKPEVAHKDEVSALEPPPPPPAPPPPKPVVKPKPEPKPKVASPAKKPETPKVKEPAPAAKKVNAKDKNPPKKTEPVKKDKPAVKPVVKKAPAQSNSPKDDAKAKAKAAAEKAAADKQKKIEAEQLAVKMRQQKLLTEAQETIAKIDKTRDKVTLGKSSNSGAWVSSPGAISSLQIDALPEGGRQVLSDHEVSYRDELASRLKLMLKLPEYGEVKVKLTLERSGKVAKVVIVATESAANRKYIEKTLPTLTFSAFGNNFDSAGQFTFSITLSNDL